MKRFDKTIRSKAVSSLAMMLLLSGCSNTTPVSNDFSHAIDVAAEQLLQTAKEIVSTDSLPRSIRTGWNHAFLDWQMGGGTTISYPDSLAMPDSAHIGERRLCGVYDWTSGFFPGSLWYAYELTGREELKLQAIRYTNLLNPVRKVTDNHDVGFMVNCSYGNALRLSPNDTIEQVMIETADNLCSRFNRQIGCIRSWDFGSWNYPVIIDNMMNLGLLFNVYRLTGNQKYYDIAVCHAKTTKKNHFRPDYTCYHVVSYNDDGSIESKGTFQGKSDESAWARGQAWAVYGYTLCYKETHDKEFLHQAIHVADMIIDRVKTNDSIPYWDYNAPQSQETPRDASAACVTASALLDLSTLAPEGNRYFGYAEALLQHLSSDRYLAKVGDNRGFVLMHSVGSLPHGSEIDTPLNYADYYFLEAISKYLHLKQ